MIFRRHGLIVHSTYIIRILTDETRADRADDADPTR